MPGLGYGHYAHRAAFSEVFERGRGVMSKDRATVGALRKISILFNELLTRHWRGRLESAGKD